MQQRAMAYQVIGNDLYETSIMGPLLHCLNKVEGKELLAEIHSGVCWGNIGSIALSAKVFMQGFYWPSIIDDASMVVGTYKAYIKISPNSRAPSQPSQLITPSWPLQIYGIDIVGPLIVIQGNYKYTVVTVEYFTKWIEVKPLVNIATVVFKRFLWQNIIYHFGVSRKIIVDNAKAFDCDVLKDFCFLMGIKAVFASVYHPQSNKAVERANALIFTTIKKRLGDQKKGKWTEELPKVVWSHNTSISRATNFIPFKMLYVEEPVTLEEIKF
jgi:hypothetical protein